MNYVYCLIAVLGGLGAFLIGFKLLSENIEILTNKGLKKLFAKTANNRFVGVGIGTLVTCIIQSSSATTVMIVGFVNAGVMNLTQATSMIIGANIGTTITAQIVALNSFDFSKFAVLLALIGIALNMFSKKDKVKTIGMALGGLGLVFLALEFMSNAITPFKESPAIVNFLTKINNPFLLFLVGILLTALLQSSSAVTTIIISIVAAGLNIGTSCNAVLFLILGTNIGTCVTALLSSIGANSNAKRASLIHLMFNLFGALIFFIMLLVWKNFMNDTLAKWFSSKATQIAMFHTFFNLICALIFIPFVNVFVKLSRLLIKDKKVDTYSTFLDDRFLKNPSIALGQATKEISLFGDEAMATLNLAIESFIHENNDHIDDIHKRIQHSEKMNSDIISYLVSISSNDISEEDEKTISSYHHILTDFLRIGELADNVTKYIAFIDKNEITFSKEVFESIELLKVKLNEQYDSVKKILLNKDCSVLDNIQIVEGEIDTLRTNLINNHIKRLEAGTCKPQSSGVFINLISNLERAGDHLDFVAKNLSEQHN